MKPERSKVEYPLWRKKVDASLLNHRGTTIPAWAYKMWGIEKQFENCTSKKDQHSRVEIIFEGEKYHGWVTVLKKKRRIPSYRLWFTDELENKLKDIFLMSYMRDVEARLRKENEAKIEEDIPFWEFLDIEYDDENKTFYFNAYFTQKPSFPELFKRLVASPILRRVEREILGRKELKIFKQDWKPKENYETELGAVNVIYMLIDTQKKLIYIGEAENLVKRFNLGHPKIRDWDYYRYDALPYQFSAYRLEIERLLIKDFATIFKNNQGIKSIEISDYTLVNDKIDKF